MNQINNQYQPYSSIKPFYPFVFFSEQIIIDRSEFEELSYPKQKEYILSHGLNIPISPTEEKI